MSTTIECPFTVARMDLRDAERRHLLAEAMRRVTAAMDENPIQFRLGLSEAASILEAMRDESPDSPKDQP